MNKLELKIPPVAVALIVAVSMWISSTIFPEWTFQLPWRNGIVIGLIVIAGLFGVSGILAFRKADTTVNPMKPESASVFVTTGIFGISRNPMYVGILCFLTSWGAYLSHPLSLGLLILFVGYMNRFQIIPEEKALFNQFGQAYTDYKNRVRRWL